MTPAWPRVPLGEVLTERQERPTDEDLLTGRVRIVSKIGFNDGVLQFRPDGETRTGMILIGPGDLVVSGINAAKGAIAVYGAENDGPAAATIHYGAYSPKRDRVDTVFLWWLLRSGTFRELLREYVPGGIKTELKAKRLLPVPIPLPPLPEQRRIVARIEELAGRVAEAVDLRHRAIAERDALAGSAVATLLGTAQGTGCLGDYVVDCSYGTSRKTDDDDTGTPILRMGNIQQGRLDMRNLKYLHLDSSERAKLLLEPGDIVVNRTNSADLVGKCAVFDLDLECSFASYLIRLRLDAERADPRLVAAWVNSPAGRAYMFRERKQMTGQANVNATKLKALPIALPDLAVQRHVVAELDTLQAKVDELKRLQAETRAELDALMPSILDRAFKGDL